MAYTVSPQYRTKVYSGGALHRTTLTINGNLVPISNIKKITISSPLFDTTKDYFYLGTFVAQKLEIEFRNADSIDLNGIVNLSIATKTDAGEPYTDEDGYEYVPIGEYLIDTKPEDYYKNAKLTCYDKSILFKQSVDISEWMKRKLVQSAGYSTVIYDIDFLTTDFSNYTIFFQSTWSTKEQIANIIANSNYENDGYIGNLSIINPNADENTYYIKVARGSVIQELYSNVINNYFVNEIIVDNDYAIVTTQDSNDIPLSCNILCNLTTFENIGYCTLPDNIPYPEIANKNSVDTTTFAYAARDKLRQSIQVGNNIVFEYVNALMPLSAEQLLQELCNKFLGENMLGTYPTLNKNRTTTIIDPTLSGKAYISYIAEIMGGNAKMGRDGKLYIVPLKRVPSVTIDALKSKSWTLNDKYKISRVYYEDTENIFEKGDKTYNSLNIRLDNVFINGTSEEMQTIIDNLYDELNGFEFYAVKTENYGDVSLDCWDLLTYTLGNDSYNVINNNTITYEMNIASTVETTIPTKQKEEVTSVTTKSDNVTNIMKTEIDQLNNRVTRTQERTETIASDLNNNYYTKTTTNQLITDASTGLTNLFTTSGGNNLLKNTAPYRTIGTNQLENWEGNIYMRSEDSSANGNALLLKSGTASQVVENLHSGTYAVGFTYKRLGSNAGTLTIAYNGRTISIDGSDNVTYNDQTNLTNTNGEIKSYGNISGNSFTISFTSSLDDAFEIYELRLFHGSATLPWVQNQNEFKTTSVNIGEGITIESNTSNTINKLDTNGMVVYNKTLYNPSASDNSSAEVLKVTDTGIETSELIASGTSNVSGMQVTRVNNNHVFITGIKLG